MAKRYLTVEAAAEYLDMTKRAVYDKVRRSDIPHIRLGRSIRFDIQDLDLWMRRQRIDATHGRAS